MGKASYSDRTEKDTSISIGNRPMVQVPKNCSTRTILKKVPTSWSADGKFLLYLTGVVRSAFVGTGGDLWALPLTPEQPGGPLKPFLLFAGTFQLFDAQFSPDSRWIAYVSNESQRNEIYVTSISPCGLWAWGQATGFRSRRDPAPMEAGRQRDLLLGAGRAADGSGDRS